MLKIAYISKIYNESRLVRYVFRHYDNIVSHYYIYDNDSTDNTRELILKNPKVTLYNYPGKVFDDFEAREFKNTAWNPLQDYDYIINADFDEFIYHPDLLAILELCKNNGIEIIKTKGFQMFSEVFPDTDKQIYEVIKMGVPDPNYSKPIIFSPKCYPDFSLGAHIAHNTSLKMFDSDIKLLHYKIFGNEFINLMLERNKRLSPHNIEAGLGYYSLENGHQFNPVDIVNNIRKNAIDIL